MPWRLVRQLASGEFSRVYEAVTPEGATVALKVLSGGSEGQGAFDQEVSLLTRLHHPTLVSLLGFSSSSAAVFGEDRGRCFWMDWVEGMPLLEAAREAGAGRLIAWLEQALAALAYLHREGVLHGDLSPRNVVIDASERVRLLDFGVSGLKGQSWTGRAATLPYMAPERMDGLNLPASDLFALGTLFYQALSGRHPRAGAKSLEELVQAEARPLLELRPDLQRDYGAAARLIDRLIRPDLKGRLSGAAQALSVLHGAGSDETRPRLPRDYHSLRMIGAEPAFEQLRRALDRLGDRLGERSVLFCVHGGSGTGKTRFLREAAVQCALAGAAPAWIEDGLESQDVRTLYALLKKGARLSEAPGIVAFVAWDDDRLAPAQAEIAKGLLDLAETEDIVLRAFTPEQTRNFLEGALGHDASTVATFFHERTQGHPRLLTELLQTAHEEELLGESGWARDWKERLGTKGGLEEILEARWKRLPPAETRILEALAVLEGGAREGELEAFLERRDLHAQVAELLRRDLVLRGPTGRLSVPLEKLKRNVSETVDAPALRRRWLSVFPADADNVAERVFLGIALKEAGAVAAEAPAALQSLSEAGRREQALELADRCLGLELASPDRSRICRLRNALLDQMGRYEDLLRSLDAWIAVSPADEPELLRQVKYWLLTGIAYQSLDREDEAERRLKRCLEEPVDPADPLLRTLKARAHSLLGAMRTRRGETAEAAADFEDALRLVGNEGWRRAEICRNYAELKSRQERFEEALSLLAEARGLFQADGRTDGEYAVALQEGNLLLRAGRMEAADRAYLKAVALAEATGDDLGQAAAWNNRGVVARRSGRLAEALALLEKAHEVFRFLGGARDRSHNLAQLAMARAEVGHFTKAQDALEQARREAGALDHPPESLAEAESVLRSLRDGVPPPAADAESVRRLREIHDRLPPELQITFAARKDFQEASQDEGDSMEPTKPLHLGSILDRLDSLNRDLLREEDPKKVLERLMDAAMELAQAETGFLVLHNEESAGPVPGFDVAVARNVPKETLGREEFAFSLSAVRFAVQSGRPVVTDNALTDPVFQNARSVQLNKLKSIVALPVVGKSGVLGVFYLDHRFQTGLFSGDLLTVLRIFAGIAALSLQKGEMIEQLRRANEGLREEVLDRSERVEKLEREVKESRLILKKEYREIVGRSPKMLKVLNLVDRITDSKVPVWIYGESGTGKEAVARALHFNSPRVKQPFVTENCSALPESLLESELFGHVRGAFTHAVKDKKGILQYADKGTIFLDEVADMSLSLQAKLLRFLQEGEIRPIGSSETVKVDVRVISASNKDIAQLVAEGKFREDLYYRLNGITIPLPPLRERLEDLPPLVEHFLKKIAEREKRKALRIHPSVMQLFMKYDWPGNIRELQNTLETAAHFSEKDTITRDSLEFKQALFRPAARPPSRLVPVAAPVSEAEGSAGGEADPELLEILKAIRDHGYHRGEAAKALGISRRYLYTKLGKFGITATRRGLKDLVQSYLK